MKMTGESFWFEAGARITDAVLLPKSLSVDYEDDDGPGHLEATSADHVTFTGTYGHPRPDPHCHVEFELYRAANGHVLLCGKWWNATTGGHGTWLIKLTRAETG